MKTRELKAMHDMLTDMEIDVSVRWSGKERTYTYHALNGAMYTQVVRKGNVLKLTKVKG